MQHGQSATRGALRLYYPLAPGLRGRELSFELS